MRFKLDSNEILLTTMCAELEPYETNQLVDVKAGDLSTKAGERRQGKKAKASTKSRSHLSILHNYIFSSYFHPSRDRETINNLYIFGHKKWAYMLSR